MENNRDRILNCSLRVNARPYSTAAWGHRRWTCPQSVAADHAGRPVGRLIRAGGRLGHMHGRTGKVQTRPVLVRKLPPQSQLGSA